MISTNPHTRSIPPILIPSLSHPPHIVHQAREGSYFKSEQEDELSAYRKRRIREGALKPHESQILLDGETELFAVSDTKLAEIHAQETRVSARELALRRRVTSQMPPISTAGGYARSRLPRGMGKVPSARNAKWAQMNATDAAAEMALLPEETEAMRKSKAVAEKALRAGTRALLYGSLIAAAGVTGSAVLIASYYDIRSQADLQAFLQRAAGPTVVRLKTQLAPWKEWLETAGGGGGLATRENGGKGLSWVENSAIVQELRRKFRARPRRRMVETGGEANGTSSPSTRPFW